MFNPRNLSFELLLCCADLDLLWDRVFYLASFRAHVSPAFKGVMLFLIFIDWRAVCEF